MDIQPRFQEQRSATTVVADINLMDLLYYLLRFWPWFIITIIIGSGLMYYYSGKQPYTYQSIVTVIVRDPSQRTSIDLEVVGARRPRINVENERLHLRSRSVIASAIENTQAHINYRIRKRLRPIELYKSSPFKVSFTDSLDFNQKFLVSYKDSESVLVEYENQTISVKLGDELVLGKSSLVITPNESFATPWPNASIQVVRNSVKALAASYQSRLEIEQETRSTVLTLSLTDRNKQKASDLLEAIVEAYNKETNGIRNQIAVNTAHFINKRIESLGEELSVVESSIDSFQRANRYISPNVVASGYVSQSQSARSEVVEFEAQKRLAQYLLA